MTTRQKQKNKNNNNRWVRWVRSAMLGCSLLLLMLCQLRILMHYDVPGTAGFVAAAKGGRRHDDAASALPPPSSSFSGTATPGPRSAHRRNRRHDGATNATDDGGRKEEGRSPSSSSSTSLCVPQEPNFGYEGNKPLYVPAYPGSGSELVRSLVLAVSGNVGIDVHGGLPLSVNASTLTAKTHWPSIPFGRKTLVPALWEETYSPHYVLLLRNPKDAIPSYFSHRYEQRMNLPFHSSHPPEEAWVRHRDAYFFVELRGWTNLIVAWKQQERKTSYYKRAMILQYEALTAGPEPLLRLSRHVLQGLANVTTIVGSDGGIECLWHAVVCHRQAPPTDRTGKAAGASLPGRGGTASGTKRGDRTYIPPYTSQHKDGFLQELAALKRRYRRDADLVDVLDQYIADINATLRVVDDDDDDDDDYDDDDDDVLVEQNVTVMR